MKRQKQSRHQYCGGGKVWLKRHQIRMVTQIHARTPKALLQPGLRKDLSDEGHERQHCKSVGVGARLGQLVDQGVEGRELGSERAKVVLSRKTTMKGSRKHEQDSHQRIAKA